ncbi:MAG: feruloyl-CoA synthase [Candidatus Andeanibacterium colombiense]|uniref:Feruloyl-CoA synthase n=1 Tax=Candidatus Andeanibacterium colombiense TaxID=3121345 RepID=A0AAJ5X7Z3_9SPHN|nr:MAG: feruloyl-CoA synthase [Sphingomonadaceae bacterium]
MSDTTVSLGARDVLVETRPNGEIVLRNPDPLGPYPARFTERLERWAAEAPDRVFLGERAGSGWRTVTFAEALRTVEAIGQALVNRGLDSGTPLMILAANSIDHALVALACMHVGVPSAPISLGYATLSTDFERLAYAVGKVGPAAVFTNDAGQFATALTAVLPPDMEIIATSGTIPGRTVTPLAELKATVAGPGMAAARDAVTADTPARLIFTSGSSSLPKAVINTHGMLASNQQMHAQVWRFMEETPPVMADWAPWNHTAGANVALGAAVYFGGSLYIDDGRATPKEIRRSVENAAEIRPTVYFGVPLVYQLIAPILRADPALREGFFGRLQMLFYAGGMIADGVWDDLRSMMVETRGDHVYTCGGYGATEMSPSVLLSSWDAGRPGIVGLPVPGITLKLTPIGEKLEARVKGPSVTPGYWRSEEATTKAYDEERWYCTGDAVRFVDPDHPLEGMLYDGRLSENFKLSTGTWVAVANLRTQAVKYFEPLVGDAVVVGQGESEIGLVLFPILEAGRRIAGCEEAESLPELLAMPSFQDEIQRRLEALSMTGSSATTRVTRAVLVAEPPSGVEITDKNTLSFNAVMNRREADIRALYSGETGDRFVYSQAASVLSRTN